MRKFLITILVSLLVLMSILIYARFRGTIGLNTNNYTIVSKNIPISYNNLKIVHFSDIHYGKVITKERIRELVKEVNSLKPDIVVFTGDLLDNDYKTKSKDIKFLMGVLSNIEAKYGKYSIIGDNDYLNEDIVRNIYLQSDFVFLDNNYAIIKNENNDSILLAGVNSYIHKQANIKETTKDINDDDISYSILLMHESDYMDEVLSNDYNFDLVLAGHSLNGSINIPFIKNIFLEKYGTKYYNNYYEFPNTKLYVSNGVGVSNINFRLFNTPSINIYRFKK